MTPRQVDANPDGVAQRSVLVVVFTTILIDFVGFSVLIPVLPLYAERLGATPFEVGLILTVYALAQLLFLPAWGWVSDRVGRRPVSRADGDLDCAVVCDSAARRSRSGTSRISATRPSPSTVDPAVPRSPRSKRPKGLMTAWLSP